MTLSVSDPASGPRLLQPEGELDLLTVEPMLAQVPALVEGASALVLDLTGVTFFDSAAAQFVDRLLREGARCAVPVRVVAPRGGRARRVLEIVGMLDCVVEDVASAVQSLAG
jgi:anti-anti-sigma factor